MSIQEKIWDVSELPQNAEVGVLRDSPDFSLTPEDVTGIYTELFSGENSKRAKEVFLRIIFGLYEGEKEKEMLLSEFEEFTREATEVHLERREE